jgi:hypothetical protein
VVNHYICDQTISDVEITDCIEYFSINITSNEAEYSLLAFDAFLEFKNYLESIKIGAQAISEFQPEYFKDQLLTTRSLALQLIHLTTHKVP